MRLYETMTGKKFGRLVILDTYLVKKKHDKKGRRVAKCVCDCGTIFETDFYGILYGYTRSCGCLEKESRIKTHTVHGMRHTRIYSIWRGMNQRCYCKTCNAYPDYGGRGITICDEWRRSNLPGNPGFINFYRWSIDHGYKDPSPDTPRGERLTIERIDNNKGYSPDNCEWIPFKYQPRNRRSCDYITDLDGTVMTATDFERKYNLRPFSVPSMITNKWPLSAILYRAHHPNLKIRKLSGHHPIKYFYDKDGYIRLIPSIELQKKLYGTGIVYD